MSRWAVNRENREGTFTWPVGCLCPRRDTAGAFLVDDFLAAHTSVCVCGRSLHLISASPHRGLHAVLHLGSLVAVPVSSSRPDLPKKEPGSGPLGARSPRRPDCHVRPAGRCRV